MPTISLAAEKIASLGPFPITNSLLASWITIAVLTVLAALATRNMSMVPGRLQSVAELLIGGLYDFFHSVTGHHIKQFFPLIASLFLFIIISNWMGLLPGFGTIGFRHPAHEEAAAEETVTGGEHAETAPEESAKKVPTEHAEEAVADERETTSAEAPATETHEEEKTVFVPVLRAATADLNMTLGLAIVAVIAIQFYGFKNLGFHYGLKFINFKDPISFFLGILESMSEVSRIISFAFRLFGNIFAGEVLLAVMAFLMPFLVPLPFLMMELFVGFIQALVFAMLTAVFLNVAVSHGEE